jgi:tetratricopeptide (TPR) repeat protein
MPSIDYHDDDLNVDVVPDGEDLTNLAIANLSRWLDYMKTNPSLLKLQRKATEIMDDIQAASGLPGSEQMAIDLAMATSEKFERLGLGKPWYQKLMSLMAPALDRSNPVHRAQLFRCLLTNYLHQGDVRRANQAVNLILDIAETEPSVPITEAMLGIVSLSAVTADCEENIILGEQLLDLAIQTHNMKLVGRTFGALAQWYTYRDDFERVYQYAQMAYWVGRKSREDGSIINGLHYMGIAFRMANNLPRAEKYLNEATAQCTLAGDVYQLSYIHYTWGTWYYMKNDFERAEDLFAQSAGDFAGRGSDHATALYMHGLSLMQLKRFDEAERKLLQARKVWETTPRRLDPLYAWHALAHNAWMAGKAAEAVAIASEALDLGEMISDPRRDSFLNVLREDLERYQSGDKT